jgi:hypothetical protein
MQTLTSPFLHVQAIRRQFRDQGMPTKARARWYAVPVNFAGTLVNEEARAVLRVDVDSWFIWLSLYHLFQNAIYESETGKQAANDTTGQVVSATVNDIVEVRLMPLGSERPLHNLDFISRHHLDGFMFRNDSGAQDGELFAGGAHPIETGGEAVIGVWRGGLVEPVLMEPRAQFQVGVRRRLAAAAQPQRGHLFLFWGVALTVGGA